MKLAIQIFVLLVLLLGAYLLGFGFGVREAASRAQVCVEWPSAKLALGQYVISRDIAIGLKNGEFDRVLCKSRLIGSSALDDVRACLAKPECRAKLVGEVEVVAPEILSGSQIGIV